MNTAKLRSTIERVLVDESKLGLQGGLQNLVNALVNFTSNPGEGTYQIEVANALQQVRDGMTSFAVSYDPAALKRLDESGASRFFGEQLVDDINGAIAANQMTPAVAQQFVTQRLAERAEFILQLTNTLNGLRALGVEQEALEPGEAELGFLIPRDLFDNEFSHLLRELAAIQRIIRTFSELATGAAEPIEVRQISTTDPTFYLGVGMMTASHIGKAVRWALDTWKEIEEIRKVRAETLKLKSFSGDDVAKLFDDKITETVATAVQAKAEELAPVAPGEAGRVHELREGLENALESILARVERGMTVEIRFLPPPVADGAEAEPEVAAAAASLNETIPRLSFPPADPNPILRLPGAAPAMDNPAGGAQ